MERKIGEIFNIDNEWYQVVKSNGECCKGCAFYEKGCKAKYADVGSCGTSREDWTQVIFKKLEKVGEMYEKRVSDGTSSTFQRYRVYNSVILPKEPYIYCNFIDSTVEIEIKQTKEDMEDLDKIKVRDYTKVEELNVMEEKKLNLKPFDIQKAREGKPVCTRDGRKVRIICFDAKRKDEKSIIALVPSKEYLGFEDLIAYPDNGNYYGGHENDGDLMMLPEKKEGWVNVYKSLGVITFSHNPYATKEEAIKDKDNYYVDTIKVEWEE